MGDAATEATTMAVEADEERGCGCVERMMRMRRGHERQKAGEEEEEEGLEFPKRIPKLHSIYNTGDKYNEHRVMLEDLIRQQEASERKLARKQGSLSSARADLYQILGLFFVFQGVVLTAVSQSNMLRCRNWYLPFILSLCVSIAAWAAAVQKLREASEFSEQCRLEKALYNALGKSIEKLREEGKMVEVKECIPVLPKGYTGTDVGGDGKAWVTMERIWSVWVWSYAGGVLLLIIVFSAVTLLSVHQILCHPGDPPL